MIATLSAGHLGVRPQDAADLLAMAQRHGFAAIEADPLSLDSEALQSAGLALASVGLPVEWRKDEATFRQGLADLPKFAEKAHALGCARCATWVLPGRDGLGFDACTEFHLQRFQPIAEILDEYEMTLGLEFIGSKHLRDAYAYPWIYSMLAMRDFAANVGPNVGLLLDSYHWHTSGGMIEDLEALLPEDIVLVHLNDASPDLAPHELRDSPRRLPGETGVIDLKGFIGALKEIGYEGPVCVEPFSDELKAMPDDEARLSATAEALRQTLAL